jgi:hypothetical protein
LWGLFFICGAFSNKRVNFLLTNAVYSVFRPVCGAEFVGPKNAPQTCGALIFTIYSVYRYIDIYIPLNIRISIDVGFGRLCSEFIDYIYRVNSTSTGIDRNLYESIFEALQSGCADIIVVPVCVSDFWRLPHDVGM